MTTALDAFDEDIEDIPTLYDEFFGAPPPRPYIERVRELEAELRQWQRTLADVQLKYGVTSQDFRDVRLHVIAVRNELDRFRRMN